MKTYRPYFRVLLILFSLFIAGSCSPARQEIDALFHYMNEIRAELKSNKSEEKKQAILNKARKRILTIIDTEYVAKLSLGKYYDTLSKKDQKAFTEIFHELMAYSLVKTYIPISTFVDHDLNVELIFEEMKHDKLMDVNAIVIHTKLVNNKVWYFIDFYLHQVGKGYKLYDVHVDGASVLMDYRNQFYGIIQNKGFPYLLERLDARHKELDSG